MQSLVPELSQYWLAPPEPARVDAQDVRDSGELRDEETALEELAERVSAARSVV